MQNTGRTLDEAADWRLGRVIDQYKEFHRSGHSSAACVSSSGLAYVHEYLSLDAAGLGPTVRVVVLRRPCEEVVRSFMRKTTDRNHWQHPDDWKGGDDSDGVNRPGRPRWQRDKTWDRMFPNMPMPSVLATECTTVSTDSSNDPRSTLDQAQPIGTRAKQEAIRQYWQLYYTVVDGLCTRYPERVRVKTLPDLTVHLRSAALSFQLACCHRYRCVASKCWRCWATHECNAKCSSGQVGGETTLR
jgi:hypothetical protein